MSNAPTITRETAWHVLWHYGKRGVEPGRFTSLLMQTMDAADITNFHILADAYPELGAAMAAAKNGPDGIKELQRIATGEVAA